MKASENSDATSSAVRPLLVGAVDYLVVHVGEVLGEHDLVALVDEVSTDHVEVQERARVAHVDLVVDGGTAHIHADLALADGLELLLAMRLAVIDEHGYLAASCRCNAPAGRRKAMPARS
jgi:hypothetical protein